VYGLIDNRHRQPQGQQGMIMPKTAKPRRLFRDRVDSRASLSSLLMQADVADKEHRWADSARLIRQAIAIDPTSLPAMMMLAAVLGNHPGDEADLRTALHLVRKVLDALPASPDAHFIAAIVCQKLGMQVEFQEHLDVAFDGMPEDDPDYHSTRLARAGLWLELGDYGRGWPEYDYWTSRMSARRDRVKVRSPRWDGSDLTRRTILIHTGLDGFGDAIQFIRYAPLVKARGGTVVLVCQPTLAHLLAECDGIDRVVAEGARVPAELLRHDVQAPLMSLPAILKTTLETVPDTVPYLSASVDAIERWRPVVGAIPGFRVGITWQGDPRHQNDRFRSIALEQFAPLAAVDGIALIPLQKGPAVAQIADAGFSVAELGDAYQPGDWLDTAAVVSQLDLVISPDSSIAHLAGALARPVWIALPRPAEWRWLRDRDNSPWYPTARLFRQDRLGDWEPVFARMADELGSFKSHRS
jgi:hypothetical protein